MNDTIKFKTAKLAKEKGYDYPDSIESKYFLEDGSQYNCLSIPAIKCNMITYKSPIQALLINWLISVHNIYVSALPFRDNEDGIELCFYYTLVQDDEELNDILCNEIDLGASDEFFNTYEDALEAGLVAGLKLII